MTGAYWRQGFAWRGRCPGLRDDRQSRPSLGRSPTRPATRIAPASRLKLPQQEAVLVPAVLEFLKAGPCPILTTQVTDAFPGSKNASGRVARQSGLAPERIERLPHFPDRETGPVKLRGFWPDAATYQAAVSAIEPRPRGISRRAWKLPT